jgi:hypothetical protein
MRFLPLIWSGIWRKPVRTILTLMQVIVAFALFGVLQGVKTGVDQVIADARADVLYVAPAASGGAPLPRAYIERFRSIPGVKTVAFADALFATYQKPTQPVYVMALESSDVWLTLFPEVLHSGLLRPDSFPLARWRSSSGVRCRSSHWSRAGDGRVSLRRKIRARAFDAYGCD